MKICAKRLELYVFLKFGQNCSSFGYLSELGIKLWEKLVLKQSIGYSRALELTFLLCLEVFFRFKLLRSCAFSLGLDFCGFGNRGALKTSESEGPTRLGAMVELLMLSSVNFLHVMAEFDFHRIVALKG